MTEPAAAAEPILATPAAGSGPEAEPAAGAAPTAAASAAAATQQQEGLLEEPGDSDEDVPGPMKPAEVSTAGAAGAAAAMAGTPPPFLPPGMDAAQAQQAQEMLRVRPGLKQGRGAPLLKRQAGTTSVPFLTCFVVQPHAGQSCPHCLPLPPATCRHAE